MEKPKITLYDILDSLVFRIRDDLGRIRIESTSPALKGSIEDYE